MVRSGIGPLSKPRGAVYVGRSMGYLYVIIAAIILIPIIFWLSRRAGPAGEGEKPIGKPVMVAEPAADEPTPAASSIKKETDVAQKHTPPA